MSDEVGHELEGRRIVVIGGTSGFGLGAAQAAAREGAAVVVASRDPAAVDRALGTLPATATGFPLDARDPDALERFFDQLGPFDHLLYTAGDALDPQPVSRITVETAKHFFDLRFWGAYLAAKFGAPLIGAGGSIVFTAGLAGWRPSAGGALGASTSTALEGLTRALAVELAPVRVNLLIAGIVDTPLWDGLPAEQRERFLRGAAGRLPVGRAGVAADVARAAIYLMRQEYSTGSSVVIDGGGALV